MIVLTAAPFGFGPASALHATLSANHGRVDQDHVVLVPDALRPVFGDLTGLNVMAGDSNHVAELCRSLDPLPQIINFGNLDLLALGPSSRRHIFVDCVGWLTPRLLNGLPIPPQHSYDHVVEYFPPTHPDRLPSKAVLARPALSPFPQARPEKSGDHIVICLGGGCFPGHGDVATGLERVAEQIAQVASTFLPVCEVYITGGSEFNVQGAKHAGPVAHSEHLNLLATSRLVVTVPGLYTVFECLRLQVPVLLLPPTNYTQIVQFHWYASKGLAHPSAHWNRILKIPQLKSVATDYTTEAEITRNLRRSLKTSVVTQTITDALVEAIGDLLETRSTETDFAAFDPHFRHFFRSDLPSIGDLIWGSYGN